ncbi:hypothetical protein WJX81_006121 [Elliptochloris bilobata]|uniref:Uncharacterized protein n=1 Tax=Elliptochloris bilobata TaxID=381761 RepID=A0AAW1SJ00_9CHLO
MSTQQGRLSQRLTAFKQRFSQILGPKQHGYGELGQLEQPLGAAPVPASATSVPDPADELRALSGLAAEAAEILFEMAALHDSSEVARDMLDKAAQLQAQLRGMIGDFREGDETALAQALEAFDTLTATVEEYHTTLRNGGAEAAPSGADAAAAGPSAGGPTGGAPMLQPPPAGASSNPFQAGGGAPVATAPGHKPAGEEPPLISFD